LFCKQLYQPACFSLADAALAAGTATAVDLSDSRGCGGLIAIWLETLFGWVASLLLIAVCSGLTKKDDE
jgi:hypothetical protein